MLPVHLLPRISRCHSEVAIDVAGTDRLVMDITKVEQGRVMDGEEDGAALESLNTITRPAKGSTGLETSIRSVHVVLLSVALAFLARLSVVIRPQADSPALTRARALTVAVTNIHSTSGMGGRLTLAPILSI